jgi:hypothetical protein
MRYPVPYHFIKVCARTVLVPMKTKPPRRTRGAALENGTQDDRSRSRGHGARVRRRRGGAGRKRADAPAAGTPEPRHTGDVQRTRSCSHAASAGTTATRYWDRLSTPAAVKRRPYRETARSRTGSARTARLRPQAGRHDARPRPGATGSALRQRRRIASSASASASTASASTARRRRGRIAGPH